MRLGTLNRRLWAWKPFILACSVLFAHANQSRGEAFDYLRQAVAKLAVASEVAATGDYDYDGTGCMFGYFLDPSEESSMRRSFDAGSSYLIIGCADEDVKVLDLRVKDADGNTIASADSASDTPVFAFHPPRDGRYSVAITNSRAERASFCAFVVLKKVDDGKVQLQEIAEALGRAIQAAQVRALAAKEFPHGLVLMGGKYDKGTSNDTYDLRLAQGDYALVVAGSKAVDDADAFVVRQRTRNDPSGKSIAEDTDPAAVAICNFTADGDSLYCMRMKNAHSDGPGFVFGVVLKD